VSTVGAFRAGGVVPTYDNPRTLRGVVLELREHLPEVIVVDDGSGPEGRRAAADLEADGLAHLVQRKRNGGKGAAVLEGLRRARDLGLTHALQVDADGQHDLSDVPRFVEVARSRPAALVAGTPLFDETAPKGRLVGRQISRFWAAVETGGLVIHDPLCGFRVYPVEAALASACHTAGMDFDPDIAVRMYWRGTPVVNLPTRVRYLTGEEGGVSHFRMFHDNVLLSRMHARLSCQAAPRLAWRWLRGFRR